MYRIIVLSFYLLITPSLAFAQKSNQTLVTLTLNAGLFTTLGIWLDDKKIFETKDGVVKKFTVSKGKHSICIANGNIFGGAPKVCERWRKMIYSYQKDNVHLLWADDKKGVWKTFYLTKEYDNKKSKPSRTINEARMLCLQSGFKFGTKAFDQCIQTSTQ